jgi:hypothetical protein
MYLQMTVGERVSFKVGGCFITARVLAAKQLAKRVINKLR